MARSRRTWHDARAIAPPSRASRPRGRSTLGAPRCRLPASRELGARDPPHDPEGELPEDGIHVVPRLRAPPHRKAPVPERLLLGLLVVVEAHDLVLEVRLVSDDRARDVPRALERGLDPLVEGLERPLPGKVADGAGPLGRS